MCIVYVRRFVFLARLGLMLTRVEMIDKLGSFLEGHGFEFKCPEVRISGVSNIQWVKAVLVGKVVNGGVHESSCPWFCGKITWPIPDSAKISSFTDSLGFLGIF